jgi:hypothetical protein
MDFSAHLAGIAGSVAYQLKTLEGKLCSKQSLAILKNALQQAVEIAAKVDAAPADKRLFLEAAAANTFDSLWAAAPLPFPLNTLRTPYLTNKYIRPNALWAVDLLIDEAFTA